MQSIQVDSSGFSVPVVNRPTVFVNFDPNNTVELSTGPTYPIDYTLPVKPGWGLPLEVGKNHYAKTASGETALCGLILGDTVIINNVTPIIVSGSGGGLYASLTGPGETVYDGDLTQLGGLTVTDANGDGINLGSGIGPTAIVSGGAAVYGFSVNDTSTFGIIYSTTTALTLSSGQGCNIDDAVYIHIGSPGIVVGANNSTVSLGGFGSSLGFFGAGPVLQQSATDLPSLLAALTLYGILS